MFVTVLIILTVVIAGVLIATKVGFVKDDDKNGIPDVVDQKVDDVKEKVEEVKEKVEEVKQEIKKRAERVKEEVADVTKAAKKVGKQVKQVAKAASGEPRKGRKPKAK